MSRNLIPTYFGFIYDFNNDHEGSPCWASISAKKGKCVISRVLCRKSDIIDPDVTVKDIAVFKIKSKK